MTKRFLLLFLVINGWVTGSSDTLSISITIQDALSVDTDIIPSEFNLHPAHPNPFNNSVKLRFDVPVYTKAQMRIYDLKGNTIRTGPILTLEPGQHAFQWDGQDDIGKNISSGIYLVLIKTANGSFSQKISLLK